MIQQMLPERYYPGDELFHRDTFGRSTGAKFPCWVIECSEKIQRNTATHGGIFLCDTHADIKPEGYGPRTHGWRYPTELGTA